MTEMVIDNGIIIDDVESVLRGIRELSLCKISNLEVVKKFIMEEKNTKFYVDNNLNSYVQQEPGCIYIWLDSGYTDQKGNPILISLLKNFDIFVGHVVGTIYTLAENVRSFFRLRRNIVDRKMTSFIKKYSSKVENRDIAHISDEQEYLINCCNKGSELSEVAKKLQALNISFDDEEKEELIPIEETEDVPTMTPIEEEITIGLLLEKMDAMQAYLDELLGVIENMNTENQAQIKELQDKNNEYKRVILQMRDFVEAESNNDRKKQVTSDKPGHNLLGKRGKILVIGGTDLGTNVMQGIAKTYGFEKNDFEFVEYDKAKGFVDRIHREGKYSAIIVGSCPHKTTGCAGYSSAVEMLKQQEGMPYTVDARSKSGKLKVTKESFREALGVICSNLVMAPAY